ncbi:MAG: hypothetical protein OXT73_03480 [Bacteroidota bacterium]|nr:hypothetical protein [Bacteroidota bacterium]
MQELDERILGSLPLMTLMALFFGGAFALVFGLVALVMEGLFVLSDQALLAGVSASGSCFTVAMWARRRMIRDLEDLEGR